MEARDTQRDRILSALADGAWRRPAELPGHRRRCYAIVNELTRVGVLEQGTADDGYIWRLVRADAERTGHGKFDG
jgi:hypothetical protein